ncbi:MAG: riboflavin biosynthesis protein RibF [Oscillospiraceae bacterium]|nr:riboflavin biosynthesis protein RibF [Oscillospiraceae bacterium]
MRKRVIALGFFDGVHLGHGALLKCTKARSLEYGLTAAALTFDRHPDELVHGISVCLLNSSAERQCLIQKLYGVEELLTLHFDAECMAQPWEDFVRHTLIEDYGAAHVVCGYDFRFGARGQGDAQKLAELCKSLGIGCDCIPAVTMGGETISSTRIRELLQQGRTEDAVELLGHGHLLSGRVVSGRGIGRTMGIPTANVCLQEGILLPRKGVYAALTMVDGKCYMAVVNIGSRPTVGGAHTTIEPWILDYTGDLYGRELTLELYSYLREERRFDSLEALQGEIHRNAEQTEALLMPLLQKRNEVL